MTTPSSPSAAPWVLSPEPTNLIVLSAAAEMPDADRLRAALGVTDAERIPEPPDGLAWAEVWCWPGAPNGAAVWVEPARPLGPGDPDDPALRSAAWAIGIETQLDADDPIRGFSTLVNGLADSWSDAAGLLDVNTGRWYLPAELAADTAERTPWTIRIVHAPEASADDPVWISTSGLERCGLPELELLEVPFGRAPAATLLLEEIANGLFETVPPPPGATLEIGPDLIVVLQPRAEVAPYLGDGVPGAHDPDTRARAVICGPVPEGQYRRIWRWPRDVVDRIEAGTACVFTTTRAAQRRAAAARRTWSAFGEAWARAAGDEHFRFEVCERHDAARGGIVGPAHTWHSLVGIDADRAVVADAAERTIPIDVIADWRVIVPGGAVGPEQAVHLPAMLDALGAAR